MKPGNYFVKLENPVKIFPPRKKQVKDSTGIYIYMYSICNIHLIIVYHIMLNQQVLYYVHTMQWYII